MTTPIKLRALERLAEIIEREVPALSGRVCAGPATREHSRRFPNLAILPEGKFGIEICQPDENDHVRGVVREPTPGTLMMEVGTWSGTIKLELGASSKEERYKLEHLVEQVFLRGVTGTDSRWRDRGADMRPGILLVDTGPECYGARLAFMMDDDSWEDEKVFNQEWFSVLRLTAELPAFAPRSAGTVANLRLQLTESLETIVAGDSLPSDTETVTVNADGTVTPA